MNPDLPDPPRDLIDRMTAKLYPITVTGEWLPIATAPIRHRPFNMFVVIGLNVILASGGAPYTTDPWCVWPDGKRGFMRWPHSFPPTHWCPLPSYHPSRPVLDHV
jgi:hypothetical protein